MAYINVNTNSSDVKVTFKIILRMYLLFIKSFFLDLPSYRSLLLLHIQG